MELTAQAKLNLTLDVLGRREDGYHDLRMVMQSIPLADTIQLEKSASGGLQLRADTKFLPGADKNLASIAARCFYRSLDRPMPPLEIDIQKKIPVCAGMAGGSSDAAAVLRGLNQLEGFPFSPDELARVGEQVGSDVPYCVLGGTALAEGRGEILTPLTPLPPCFVVVCKPDFSISTPELFARIDAVKVRHRPDTAGLLKALDQGDLPEVARRMFNVFEAVLPQRQASLVEEIKGTLIQCGALGAAMSGTGPTAFGLFSSRQEAETAYHSLLERYRETFWAEIGPQV